MCMWTHTHTSKSGLQVEQISGSMKVNQFSSPVTLCAQLPLSYRDKNLAASSRRI